MSQFRVYQYVVFYQEPQKKDEQESKPVVIKEISTVIAKSEDLVRMQAVRELPEQWAEKLENITIVVRSF